MADDDLKVLREQEKRDRKLMGRAAIALAEIDRNSGLSNEQADVLAALRIRVEGKARPQLEDLLTVTEDMSGKPDLKDVLGGEEPTGDVEWPSVADKPKRDWPGL